MKRVIITIILLFMGFYFTCSSLSDMLAAARAKAWPTTPGIITIVDVITMQGQRRRITYFPVIKYRYSVGEKHFRNDRVAFGEQGASTMEEAISLASPYVPGKEVSVHYDPKDPQSAVLEVGIANSHWISIVPGMIFFSIGLFLCWSAWRKLHSNHFSTPSGF